MGKIVNVKQIKNVSKSIVKAILPYGLWWLYNILKKENRNKRQGMLKPLIKHSKESPEFIVTLTSYGQRVHKKAPYALHSLFNQTVQPDRIVLWLTHGTAISSKLRQMQSMGLEIYFCDDIKSYKKLIPALIKFPNDVLITADDDVYYSHDWFKMLKEAYFEDPTKIYCHCAYEICLDEDKHIIPYSQWRKWIKTIEYTKRLFPIGVGGILYPPHSFTDEILDVDKLFRLTPTADDIWFWAMARYNDKAYMLVKHSNCPYLPIGTDEDGLWVINSRNKKNDEQIRNIVIEYPKIYKMIL
jgi:hypothetical protein